MFRLGRNLNSKTLLTRRFSLPPTRAQDTQYFKQNPYTRDFRSNLSQVAHLLRRFLKVGALSAVSIGTAALALFQGAHLYVEKISLVPEDYSSNPHTADLPQYGWDQELDNWTASTLKGGTDPNMSWRARQAVRAAWMSSNWGGPMPTSTSDGSSLTYDKRLVNALHYLETALLLSPELGQRSRAQILILQGKLAESLGTEETLNFSKTRFQEALNSAVDDIPFTAKLHSHIAEILARLGKSDEAIDSYWNSMKFIDPGLSSHSPELHHLRYQPASARLLLRNLTALSSLYCLGDLKFAHSAQKSFADLAQKVASEQLKSTSPSGVLHGLYLQQRISTLKIHQAEVIYTLTQSRRDSVALLSTAATMSEQVALTLSEREESDAESVGSVLSFTPAEIYRSSNTLLLSANTLLLDARRSAATAYRLLALLQENQGKQGARDSLKYLEKALWWCGGVEGPSPNVPVVEWETVWKDYKRARDEVYVAD